ncbi:MAG: RsmD family RNA methyltransferase, partial [Verrucomicrobiota bacterium]
MSLRILGGNFRGRLLKSPKTKLTRPTLAVLRKAVFDILLRNLTNEQADKFVQELSHIPTIALHKILSWNIGTIALLISHATATKQHGIVKVAESLKISEHEMIGVGDGYNDF